MEHAAQQQRYFRRRRSDIAVRLVDHDPAQQALRGLKDRLILAPDRHIFEHRRVGDEDRRRVAPERRTITDLFGRPCLVGVAVTLALVEHQPVEQREANVAGKGRCPTLQPLFLTRDQSVERVQHERPHARKTPAARRFRSIDLAREIVEHRNQEAFRFARAGAAGYEHRARVVGAQMRPRLNLVRIGRVIEAIGVI